MMFDGRTTGKPRDGFGVKTKERTEPKPDRRESGKLTDVPDRAEGPWTREEAGQSHREFEINFPALEKKRAKDLELNATRHTALVVNAPTGLFKREKVSVGLETKAAERVTPQPVETSEAERQLAREIEEAKKMVRRIPAQEGCRKPIHVSVAAGRAVLEELADRALEAFKSDAVR